NELKNLEYDLNEQKRTLNQSFEKTLTELHLKQENRKKGLKNAFLNVISFGYYFKKIDSDTKKQENALLNTLQNAREEASITYKELEKANTGLLETKKRLENELTQEKYKHEDTKKRLEIAIQKGENQQNKAKELLNPTDYAKLYPTNAQNTHLRDKRQGIGR
ncbi:hypothetical protein CQA37_09675, partial [Helicobacter sp. MIT 99-10781]|uniref:hypothetical protein n=2 Tax=unclassified Helicobacter TaxID=2593540 RepID=UPI000E3A89F8